MYYSLTRAVYNAQPFGTTFDARPFIYLPAPTILSGRPPSIIPCAIYHQRIMFFVFLETPALAKSIPLATLPESISEL